ncbi:hypothetical protein P154DRAFT_570556 [Amniculicola lignicola CBS 123094]|uniref:CSC1/OSCA1-like 7TM region domain-containing protein n=1 Tax=Amniculicola lignicola CBS 123094 TaxID=1392246 RepID=A0A6A5X1P9_9PLEO|nr:hypothetical protein P154DRAFT_570556 [Amniculicola lignicola CBS 123094]
MDHHAERVQEKIMLVFTVVTTIFLPLSFMSSFFALQIAAFPRDSVSGQVNRPIEKLLRYFVGISLSISILLILIAFNVQVLAIVWDTLRSEHMVGLAIRLTKLLPDSPK